MIRESNEGPNPLQERAPLALSEWERGIVVAAAEDPSIAMYLWFWEWNMFGAIHPGYHTHGTFENTIETSADRQSAVITTNHGIRLILEVGPNGVDMDLEVTNSSATDWGDLASIIPCFNPGPPDSRTHLFRTPTTSFVGSEGLAHLEAREIHFNESLRSMVMSEAGSEHGFPWSDKWPTSSNDATRGLLLRESRDSKWVTGIAWDRFLSSQGNNPWECMHLAARIGPLAANTSRNVHGTIYLQTGTKEDLLLLSDDESYATSEQPRHGDLRARSSASDRHI